MAIKTLTIDGDQYSAQEGETILTVMRQHNIPIPTLCHLEGLSTVGACRLCVVQVEGIPKLLPACTTRVEEGMVIHTATDKLKKYRRMIIALLASEGNHVCAVCVANNHCELQELAYQVGLVRVRYPYLFPKKSLDATHKEYVMDRNRCVLCTRCVRVCDEVEGAHVWDVAGRGINCEIVTGLDDAWGKTETCTSCGKCVMVCPTGALFEKGVTVAEMEKQKGFLKYIITARQKKEWVSFTDGQ
ncbi:MAG: bidirectional hydrogenase complex protein HoxU [Ignavibacteriales bacterium]|nr:bidirectional hydrogenase complex protein HoxU [Ignavibacteriales bacterium]